MEKNLKKIIYLSIYLKHFAVHLKLTQHCKSTIFQQNQKRKKEDNESGPHLIREKAEFVRKGQK